MFKSGVAKTLLKDVSLATFAPKRAIISVKDTTSLQEALMTMMTHRLSSLPVVCVANDAFAGFIDAVDIATFLTKQYTLEAAKSPEPTADDLEADTIGAVLNENGKQPVELKESTPASYLVEIFADGTKRGAVFTDAGPNNIISQRDVVKWLHKQVNDGGPMASLANKTLKELNIGVKTVATVSANDEVMGILAKVAASKFAAFPIVDGDGKLVGNFSASDFTSAAIIGDEATGVLVGYKVPCLDYLKEHRPNSLNVASVVVSDDAATMASQQSTFGAVLRMLATTHIHHVWVTDAAGKPIGCVSMTDVCALICDSADYM